MTKLLEVDNLCVHFHTPEGTVFAVNGVSFALNEGETLAVVGESGCGKSVCMMSLLGLNPIPPAEVLSGTALYAGVDLLHTSEQAMVKIRGKEISMIFQDPMTSLNPVLTIHRQITESLHTHMGMDHKQATERAIELLDWVGIPNPAARLKDYPHQFSGGMRQRVMIAIALSCNPRILIADEPTTALDVTIQAQILDLVTHLRQQLGMSMIWITHDLGVVAGLADRVLTMYAGSFVEEANVDDLYETPHHPYTKALLAALPHPDHQSQHRLKSIPGSPPNLLIESKGCPFVSRCEYTIERCLSEKPLLRPVGPDHRIACWVDIV